MVAWLSFHLLLERLGNKDGLRGDTRIALVSGNRRDFMLGLGVSRDGNMRDQMGMKREST